MNKLRIALAVSVLFNLFCAAALVAGFVTLRSKARIAMGGSLPAAGAELPIATRKPFRAALRETRRAMHDTALASQAAKLEAAGLLRQPVLDQRAMLAALDRARVADVTVRAAVEQRAVAYAATMAPADRAVLADALERRAGKVPPANK